MIGSIANDNFEPILPSFAISPYNRQCNGNTFASSWRTNNIARKSVKNSTSRKLTQRNSTDAIIQNLPHNSVKYNLKACLTDP